MENNFVQNFFKALAGGFFIAMGALGFALTSSIALGALVFCTGIFLTIISNKLLFSGSTEEQFETGKFKLGELWTVWFGNLAGSALFALIMMWLPSINGEVVTEVTSFMNRSLGFGYYNIILLGYVAGILTSISYLGGRILKKDSTNISAIFAVILPIFVFCLGGFEYIAASGYFLTTVLIAGVFSPLTILGCLALISAGNFLGSATVGLLERWSK